MDTLMAHDSDEPIEGGSCGIDLRFAKRVCRWRRRSSLIRWRRGFSGSAGLRLPKTGHVMEGDVHFAVAE